MEIRSKQFGEALNEWFRSMGRNWKPLLFSSLAIHIPLAVLLAFLFSATGGSEAFSLYLDPNALETMSDAEILDALAPFLWMLGIWTLLQIIAGVFVYLAAARTIATDMADRDVSWIEVTRFAASRTTRGVAASFLVVLGAVLLSGLVVLIGWAVISAGGVGFLTVFVTATAALTGLVVMTWLGLSFSLGVEAIAMEDVGPVTALGRSFYLVQGRWWATLGYLLVTALIASAVSQVLSIVLTPLFLVGMAVPALLAVGFGASALIQGPLLAAIGAAYAIWYVDLRARDQTLFTEQLI